MSEGSLDPGAGPADAPGVVRSPLGAAVLVAVAGLTAAPAARADAPGGAPDPASAAAATSADLARALRLRLAAPLAGPRDAFFYSGLLLPPLAAATTPPPGTFDVRLRTSFAHSAFTRDADGQRSRFDGLFIGHARLDLAAQLTARVQLQATLRFAGWEERRDVFLVYDDEGGGLPIIEGEAAKLLTGDSTGRHENLAQLQLGALVRWWEGDDGASAFATAVAVKLPGFRRADLTSSGTGDVALTALLTLALGGGVTVHVNEGLVVPTGDPWLYEDAPRDLDPFGQGALGVTWAVTDWLALGASLEGATSPWEEVKALDRPAASAAGGARLLLGRFFVEVGAGAGLGSGGPDWLAWVEVGWASPPAW